MYNRPFKFTAYSIVVDLDEVSIKCERKTAENRASYPDFVPSVDLYSVLNIQLELSNTALQMLDLHRPT